MFYNECKDRLPSLSTSDLIKTRVNHLFISTVFADDVDSPDSDSPNHHHLDIKVPHVQVANPKNVTEAIRALPTTIPTNIIDQLISAKPKNLTEALTIISDKLGKAFKVTGLDAPIDSKKLVRELEAVKQSGGKSNRLTLISRLLKQLKPLETDKHRLYRIVKFFRNLVKTSPEFKNLFNQLLPSDEVPNVPTCMLF